MVQDSQLRKGVLDLAVMLVLQHGEGYGYELNRALAEAGFDDLGDATIYGTLRRLEQAAWLHSRLVPSTDGPARKYYALTAAGHRRLREGMTQWNELVSVMQALEESP
jgi:PadR family transcriptional regulator PadR